MEFARSSTDRMLLGVCGGVARRYGVDAYVVRIALLLLTLTGGLGVVLYIVGFALSTPADESSPPRPSSRAWCRRARSLSPRPPAGC